MGLPLRLNSARISSYCKSSTRPWSFTKARSGGAKSSGILDFAVAEGVGIRADSLGEFEFLQLGLDCDGVLGFCDDFLASYHAGEVFINEKTIERDHAVLGAGLNIGLDAEGFIIADEGGDGRRVD